MMMLAWKIAAALLVCPHVALGFVSPIQTRHAVVVVAGNNNDPTAPTISRRTATAVFAAPSTDEETKIAESSSRPATDDGALSKLGSAAAADEAAPSEGLPWWWDMVWKLDVMKLGKEGEDIIFGDSANVLRTNIEQIFGGFPSLDGCPLAEGDIADIADGTMFIGLQRYHENYGSPYKLCFGPKSFLVISDPVQAKHILRDANVNYDKVRLRCEQFDCQTSWSQGPLYQTHSKST